MLALIEQGPVRRMKPTAPPRPSAADWCVAALGVVVLAVAIWMAAKGVKLDDSILILIGIGALLAAWPALSARLSKLSIGKDGVSVELTDRLAAVEAKAASTQTAVSTLAQSQAGPAHHSLGKGKSGRSLRTEDTVGGLGRVAALRDAMADGADDPPAASTTGVVSRGNRKLEAQVSQHPTVPTWAVVELLVGATPGAAPLVSPVRFQLGPTFSPNDVQILSPGSSGIVSLHVTSEAAFTVEVETDGGQTRLELDLSTAPGAFSPWKDR